MFKAKRTRKRAVAILIAAIGALMIPLDATAQYTGGFTNYVGGNMPYTGSYQWWWMAQSLMYPFARLGGGSAFNSTYIPFYTASSMITGAGYVASRMIANRRQQKYANQDATDSESSDVQAARYNGLSDQMQTDEAVQARRLPADGAPSVAPRPAPDRRKSRDRHQGSSWQPNDALAQGFIDLVNSKYGGDISQALADPQTRAFAKALSVINDTTPTGKLSDERIGTIRSILNDNSETPAMRINAVHMLLKD